MSKERNKFSLFLWSYSIGVNGILLVSFFAAFFYCSFQFVTLWNKRADFTFLKVSEQKKEEAEAEEKRIRQQDEAVVDSDTSYDPNDLRVPEDMMKKAEKQFFEKGAADNIVHRKDME